MFVRRLAVDLEIMSGLNFSLELSLGRMLSSCLVVLIGGMVPASAQEPYHGLSDGRFQWSSTGPLLGPPAGIDGDPAVSVKDPSVVRFDNTWHLFNTVRFASKRVQLEYVQLNDWNDAEPLQRVLLDLHKGYIAAPQVFFFEPHQRWYLIFQMADESSGRPWGPWFSTTPTLADPNSWTKPQPLYSEPPQNHKWLDFWIICDDNKAHLFHTSNNGKMWRAETDIRRFPHGWNDPQVVLEADIFEASETYFVPQMKKFLTIIEAQRDRRRYHKAYVAESLGGEWEPLADSVEQPFAAASNVLFEGATWTHNISHGELIRSGVNQRLEINADRLELLYQGVSDAGYRSNGYAMIPWRLGLATSK